MRITHALTAVVVGFGLALTGCGDDEDSEGASPSPESNDADISFAQEMILHHQQAIMMASLADDGAKDPAVVTLAGEIQQAQDPEIELLQGWLEDWDAEMSHEMGEMGHGMPGMMSDDELARLNAASGRAFDRMFLRLMIEHHEGAIEMARTEQADGQSPEAIELAERIESAQAREIDRMQALLGR